MPDPIGAHYLDHCGVSVRTPESTIIFDPITPDLAADAVCVSHCHEDHFNPEVLSTFDRSTTIVVPRILKPRGKSSPNAVEKLVAFRPGGEADAKTYGALLSDALRELARLEGTQRGKSVAPELDRLRFLESTWETMNSDLRSAVLDSLSRETPGKTEYIPPKALGRKDGELNPDLGKKARSMGFTTVVELLPWEEVRIGDAVVTHVPARFAHGITEQATYMLECPAFTLFHGADALEDGPVHSYLGRNHDIDVAFLSISGREYLEGSPWQYRNTMNVDGAIQAAKWLDAKCVIPLQDSFGAADLRKEMCGRHPPCRILEPGETWTPPAS